MNWSTTDLCDAYEDLLDSGELQIVQGAWLAFGARQAFSGPVRLARAFEDNSVVAAALQEAGQGAVLVVDGGGSMRRAMLGGNLARAAAANGWVGIVVHGAVRDVEEIDATAIGVRALGLCPRRTAKRGLGKRDVPVSFCGVTMRPGCWLYVDRDSMLVSPRELQRP